MHEPKRQPEFYYIEVKPKEAYKAFRTYNVEDREGIDRVVGQRENGVWDTVKWLIRMDMAHIENGLLVADHPHASEVLERFVSEPKHIEGNLFEAAVIEPE